MSLALWLRAGRVHRGMTIDDVAKVTKIQPRILDRLEAGKLDGLPADVFVRGFVRSFARCVGLEEAEALRRYAACGLGAPAGPTATAAGTTDLTTTARALVEAMAELVPDSAGTVRATPRKMIAMEVIDLAVGSLQDLPVAGEIADGTMVGTLRLPDEAVTGRGSEAPAAAEGSAAERPTASVEAVPCAPEVATESAGDSSKRKRSRRAKARDRRAARISRELLATGTPPDASPVVTAPRVDVADDAASVAPALNELPGPIDVPAPSDREPAPADLPGAVAASSLLAGLADEPIATATWSPKMPPVAAAPSVPWRKPVYAPVAAALVPSLVIDDADPDSAERVLEERAEKHSLRRSFLPPILLDREDRSARQGGLTLAVIILLIAATLTLSYLMRRPGASGDGMTRLETTASNRG